MKGFVLAHGRSGTTWIARALTACTDLDARHESMGKSLGQSFGGVESNGNFWRDSSLLRHTYPGVAVVHQVRDGRKVLRSVMTRKVDIPDWPFEQSCTTWTKRNEKMMRDIPDTHRFRLEDLIQEFDAFKLCATLLGAKTVNMVQWERERLQPANVSAHAFPVYDDWSEVHKRTFWDICGAMMVRLRYV